MLNFGKSAPEQAKRGAKAPKQGAAPAPDVVSAFPRGLPDGDQHKPGAAAHWVTSAGAVDRLGVWEAGRFLIGKDAAGRYAGHQDDRHIVTVAGSRAGKGISLIVPNLLFWPGSCIAIDPKGELATITASRRSAGGSHWSVPMEPGHGKVYALDPFKRVTGPAVQFRSSFNPLADLHYTPENELDPDDSTAAERNETGLELAGQIADALVIQSTGDGAHWTQSARSFLRGLILFVAADEAQAPASKTLIRLRELVTQDRDTFNAMLARMSGMGGIIGRTADSLKAKPDSEKWSVVSTCNVHTDFLEGEPMRRVLCGSDFRLEDLKAKRVTVYLCIPATRLATHGRWLRLMIGLAIEAMERTGPLAEGQPPVLFAMDEFAALGHMESIEKAAGQIAGFGVKLWPIVQDLTQLQRDYKEAWETFMGNAGLLTFFGNTDITTAEHIAKRLGDVEVIRTVRNLSKTQGKTEGKSNPDALSGFFNQGGNASVNAGFTESQTENLNEQIVRGPLMNPNEIIQAFSREAGNVLAFVPRPHWPPLALHRCVYFSVEDEAMFGGLFDPAPGQPLPRVTAAARKARDRVA